MSSALMFKIKLYEVSSIFFKHLIRNKPSEKRKCIIQIQVDSLIYETITFIRQEKIVYERSAEVNEESYRIAKIN